MRPDSMTIRTIAWKNGLIAAVMLTLAVLSWSMNAIAGRMADGLIPAFTLSFWRWVIALVLLLPFGWRQAWQDRFIYQRHWLQISLMAVVSVGAYNTLQYWALNYTTAIQTGVVGATMPAMVLLLGWLFRVESANAWQLTGLVLALSGALLTLGHGDLHLLFELRLNFGDILMELAIISWAAYSLLLRHTTFKLQPVGMLLVLIVVGLFSIAPFYAWDLVHHQNIQWSGKTMLLFAYVGIFPSIMAYLFWIRGVARLGAPVSALFMNFIPIFTGVLSIWLLQEKLHGYHIVSIILVATGIALSIRRKRPAAQQLNNSRS